MGSPTIEGGFDAGRRFADQIQVTPSPFAPSEIGEIVDFDPSVLRKMQRRTLLGMGVGMGAYLLSEKLNVAKKLDLGVGLFAAVGQEPLQLPERGELHNKLGILYNTMITDFNAGNDLFYGKTLEADSWWKHGYASVWPHGRALDAIYTMGLIPGIEDQSNKEYVRRRNALKEYWHVRADSSSTYDNGLPELRFWARDEALTDDNLWIGLMLAREYKQTSNPSVLGRARDIFQLAVSQWDTDRGGIHWKVQLSGETNIDRGIVSNATAVMLGVDLARFATNEDDRKEYQKWCKDIFAWTKTLQDKSLGEDGLFSDKFYFDEKLRIHELDTKKWTYTQGVMIGAMVKLHEMDPTHYQLQDAVDLANASMKYFDSKDRELHEHDHGSKRDGYEGNEFNAIYFSNLLYLADQYGDEDFKRKVQYTLGVRIKRLEDSYYNLLHQAGAVHLTALALIPEKRYQYLV